MRQSTLKSEYPSPEMILAGKVMPRHCYWIKAVEHTKVEENAEEDSQGHGQEQVWCMAAITEEGGIASKYISSYKRKTAKLLQQFGGMSRFGKRKLHLS